MDHFVYRAGRLWAEDVPLAEIAEAVGTPVYVYSDATLRRHLGLFQEALDWGPHLVCFAVKACGNVAVLRLLAEAGAGMDVVSEGEWRRARAAGVPGERIVFSGVGKTRAELRCALAGGVRQINVESEPELRALSAVAAAMGLEAPVAIRVNPDVDARTHPKIATGLSGTKFGIPAARAREAYRLAASLPGIRVVGVDVHIGSQITDLAPFEAAFRRVAELTEALRADGHRIERLDLGGGLGIPYAGSGEVPPLPRDWGAAIRRTVGHLGCEVTVEPGRLIAGNAGVLLSRVLYVKEGEGRDFLILDAGMNDLVRPALYDAHHDIVPETEAPPDAPRRVFDVVGPVCETGDIFARGREMPVLAEGDLVAFRSAGAYGAAMASEYNSRPLVPEVLVRRDQFAVIRRRPTFDEMIARDSVPPWL
ncbi:diaminopimelate decarboxylase [Rubellimicrobium sp. CFH 75288]|uniref:diaminopimelate decarboxylase n=1 Tax=Rubellimicrobium sp. CFH 75288 TaxID=2697034 RepID=UPI0014136B5D|nr:diaminopimelate decarboxylase [Rubellimicrobium sp. CFH 75288]NAZ38001.1 diaminopimelate decarboxylase [Rubellimicrobium sp. CFH 75288]